MTESASPHIATPRITVMRVQSSGPPFRIVEIDGELAGKATSMTDVLLVAASVGVTVHDLDDPGEVRWVGGGKFTWKLH